MSTVIDFAAPVVVKGDLPRMVDPIHRAVAQGLAVFFEHDVVGAERRRNDIIIKDYGVTREKRRCKKKNNDRTNGVSHYSASLVPERVE